jgi:hypothetical protein
LLFPQRTSLAEATTCQNRTQATVQLLFIPVFNATAYRIRTISYIPILLLRYSPVRSTQDQVFASDKENSLCSRLVLAAVSSFAVRNRQAFGDCSTVFQCGSARIISCLIFEMENYPGRAWSRKRFVPWTVCSCVCLVWRPSGFSPYPASITSKIPLRFPRCGLETGLSGNHYGIFFASFSCIKVPSCTSAFFFSFTSQMRYAI